jgi:hypothetical protein
MDNLGRNVIKGQDVGMFKVLPQNSLSAKPLTSEEVLGTATFSAKSTYLLGGLLRVVGELESLAGA